jgi:hypothetical protein
MQFELVSDAPAEYLRLIADLASPAATATMRGGGKLLLETTDVAPEARHGRSVSQAMFQSAAMEYGNGRRADFDPVLGLTTDARGHLSGGLGPPEQTKVLKALFGVYYRTETFMTEAQGRQALAALRGFDTAAHSNRPVIIELDQGQNNHAVTLERVADGRVVYRDPYGTLRSMPEALFPQFVVAIHLPPEVSLD